MTDDFSAGAGALGTVFLVRLPLVAMAAQIRGLSVREVEVNSNGVLIPDTRATSGGVSL